MNREALAWAAGFYDGEGSTYLQMRAKENGKLPRPVMSIIHNTKEQLDRFVNAVGDGKVYGPYKRKGKNHSPYHQLLICGRNRVAVVLERLWPYLCSHKRDQADLVFTRLELIRRERDLNEDLIFGHRDGTE